MIKRGFRPNGVELKEISRSIPDISDDPYIAYSRPEHISITVAIQLKSDGDVSGATKENIEEAVYNALPELIEIEQPTTRHEKKMRRIIYSKIKSIEKELKKLKSFANNLKH